MKTKRVFLIVLDSFGVGELPDAAKYGDCGSDTFGAVSRSEYLDVPNMRSLGLFNIESRQKVQLSRRAAHSAEPPSVLPERIQLQVIGR